MTTRISGPTQSQHQTFGVLLRQARVAAALSQEALAERAGLSARGISDLERGIHPTPRLETVRMLANALALDEASRIALLTAARSAACTPATVVASFVPLPVPLTHLIGREREVVEIGHLLRNENVRLLTLTGPGGCGKTRLAIAAAGTMSDEFVDGVTFVDLAALADSRLVPPTVAQALDLKDPLGRGPEEALQAYLADRRVLLVLDNFEHLLDAAPFATHLLRSAPALKILATSREPLRVRGEREFAVASLALPQPITSPVSSSEIARLGRCASVNLFVARARDARSDFSLSTNNAGAVAEICRRLDGLPLALELAAARVRVLPPQALLQRLGPALPVLTGGARDAPVRHRTLHDTIAWSHKLLTAQEQTMFRSLACFVGGWVLDAAEAVADPHRDLNAFETLSSLAEKNLVRVDQGVFEPRYTMLETIREFALEQLTDSGADHAVRDRHVMWCLALGEEAEPALEGFGGTQVRWLARLDQEVGNLRAALAWLDQIGDATRLLRLVTVLDTYWYLRPNIAEVNYWLEKGLRAPGMPDPIRTAALHLACSLAYYQGDGPNAITYAQENLEVAEAWGDPFGVGRAHFDLGLAWELSGDITKAAEAHAEAVQCFRHVEAVSWIYLALAALGSVHHLVGNMARAVPLLDEALHLVQQVDETDPTALRDHYGRAQILGLRAFAARTEGDWALATRLFVEEYDIAQDLGASREVLSALAGLAGIALDRGQPERAARWLGAIDAAREAHGLAHIADFLQVKQIHDATCRALGEVAFGAYWQDGRMMPIEQVVVDALAGLEHR